MPIPANTKLALSEHLCTAIGAFGAFSLGFRPWLHDGARAHPCQSNCRGVPRKYSAECVVFILARDLLSRMQAKQRQRWRAREGEWEEQYFNTMSLCDTTCRIEACTCQGFHDPKICHEAKLTGTVFAIRTCPSTSEARATRGWQFRREWPETKKEGRNHDSMRPAMSSTSSLSFLVGLARIRKIKRGKGDLWHQPTTIAFNHNFLGEFKRLGSWFVWAAICLGRYGMDWNGTETGHTLERQACWSMPSTNAEVQRFWWTLECNILRTMWMWYNFFIFIHIYSIGKEQKILTQGANNRNADIKFFRLQTIFELHWEQIWARRRLANVSAFTCWSIWCRKTWGSNEPAQRVSTAVAAKSWRAQEAFWQILVWLKLMLIMGRTRIYSFRWAFWVFNGV